MRWTKKDSLDLEGLAMPKGFSDPEALARIRQIHSDSSANVAYVRPDYDEMMKHINKCIYRGTLVSCMGLSMLTYRRMQLDRMCELFGFDDDSACYAWLDTHGKYDPDVGELLVQDALVTGKWKELPDELQAVYHARKGDAT